VTERKQAEQTILENQKLLRTATEHARVGLVIVSPSHRYLYANSAYAEVLGLPTDQIVGQHIENVLPFVYHDKIKPRLTRAFLGEHVEYELELSDSDRCVAVSYQPQQVLGEIRSVIVSVVDITERRKQAEALIKSIAAERAAYAESEKANRLKDEFLAVLSHELRTPLSAILGWIQLIKLERIAATDLQRGLEVIERNARTQTRLIEDLLDISRITSGQLRLDVQSVDLCKIIESVLSSIEPGATAKNIRLQNVLDPSAGPVSGDPGRLQQIIWNLLSNAVKFTPKGGRVQTRLERVESHIELTITDNGEGIREEFLPFLFDRFRQADQKTTRRHGGMGLGLSIVKELTELHGGTVKAFSPGEGLGATFVIVLPLGAVVRPTAASNLHSSAKAEKFASPWLDGLPVLVVDDEPDALEVMHQILQEKGAEVMTARSVEEALELVRNKEPRILLSDIGMPGRDGYDLIRTVRSLGISAKVLPAVALTAFARAEDRQQALLAGYQMHLAKPVEPTELTAAIASLAGLTGS